MANLSIDEINELQLGKWARLKVMRVMQEVKEGKNCSENATRAMPPELDTGKRGEHSQEEEQLMQRGKGGEYMGIQRMKKMSIKLKPTQTEWWGAQAKGSSYSRRVAFDGRGECHGVFLL